MPTSTSGRRLLAASTLVMALVAGSFAASPAGASTPQNRSYVQSLYKDILDRPDPLRDPSGIEFWANQLSNPPSRAQRADLAYRIMFGSNEYFGFQVEYNFNLYLERSADPSGYDYYVRQWRAGAKSQEDVAATLIGSSEFYRRAGSTNDRFIDRAYFDVFGRTVDPEGLNYYRTFLQTRSRGSLGRVLLRSTENIRKEVTYKYSNLLDRDPSASELSYWVNARRNGTRFEALDLALVASSEYYAANSVG